MLTVTVSGSFHRHLSAINSAVNTLTDLGVRVLSPADPRVVDARDEFLFVASDRVRSVRLVQDRHLESIRASDFLWLVTPDGYVGQSASMELGFAVASHIPIFSVDVPYDLTLRQYVRSTSNFQTALALIVEGKEASSTRSGFLIDPHASLEEAQQTLEDLRTSLNMPLARIDDATAQRILNDRDRAVSALGGGRR